MAGMLLTSTLGTVLFLPVLQVKVCGRVQINVCYIQELGIKNAWCTGWSNAEGSGRTGWCQVEPFHCLPSRLTKGHADHSLHLGVGGCLTADGRERRVHQISVAQKFVLLWMMRVMMILTAAVPINLSLPFIFLAPILCCHFKKRYLPSAADGTAKQSVWVALGDVIGCVVVRELVGGQVLVMSVKPRDEEAGTPWGHSNVRHNFGYRGPLPLFSGVSWHLLKRKRRGGRVTAGSMCQVRL